MRSTAILKDHKPSYTQPIHELEVLHFNAFYKLQSSILLLLP